MATIQIEQTDSEKTNLAERVKYFSNWYRAKRAVALCLRYVKSLRDRVRKKQSDNQEIRSLKVSDLKSAECEIIRAVQKISFKDELSTLKKIKQENEEPSSRVFAQERKANMKASSSLYKLDPFIDKEGNVTSGWSSQTCEPV